MRPERTTVGRMPYLDASAADLQRSHGIADDDLPDAAVVDGVWSPRGAMERVSRQYPGVREVAERTVLVEVGGCRIWMVFVLGAAMAATHAHMACVLGARAVIQTGTFGGLAPGRKVGDVLLPSVVIGRDGVSRQLSRNKPIHPDPALRDVLRHELSDAGIPPYEGTLVSTTTMALERPRDIRRWVRAGYSGVEMEAAATLSTAQHFGVPAAGAFVLIDNVGSDHTVFALTERERLRVQDSRQRMIGAALSATATAVGA
jgi:nucleoside phosphorylase